MNFRPKGDVVINKQMGMDNKRWHWTKRSWVEPQSFQGFGRLELLYTDQSDFHTSWGASICWPTWKLSDSPRIKMVSYTSSYRGIFSGLSPEVCPEATKTLKRLTMCLVSCMQMLTECSLWLFHASWVWGYDSCQVVSNSQNTDCVWLWVWQASSKHIDDIASTECTEGSGKQPLIEYHRWKESQLPGPVMATSFQSVVATILWNDHLVSFSQWFLGLQRPVVEAIEKASRWRIGSRAGQPAAFGQPSRWFL